jgi:predicted HicB family RNase H-like nuclease
MSKPVVITLRVPVDLHFDLKAASKKRGMSLAAFVKDAAYDKLKEGVAK